MAEPVIMLGSQNQSSAQAPVAAAGQSFEIHEWSGSGPRYLHVHHSDDEAWYVLEGVLAFKFAGRQVEAPAGTMVFVPAGVPHSYFELHGPARYLIILTPRLHEMIDALHAAPLEQHPEIMRKYDSEILE